MRGDHSVTRARTGTTKTLVVIPGWRIHKENSNANAKERLGPPSSTQDKGSQHEAGDQAVFEKGLCRAWHQ